MKIRQIWKEWRTTLAGTAIAILNAVANGVETKQIVIGGLITLLGALAKDPKRNEE